MVKSGAVHNSRKYNECLARTKRTLQPDLQEPVDNKGNKITGCIKKKNQLVWKNNYQVGQQVDIEPNSGARVDLIQTKMKSSIFDSLRNMMNSQSNENDCNEEPRGYLLVYPNTLKADTSPQDISRRALSNLENINPAAGAPSGAQSMFAQRPVGPFNDARHYKQRADFQSKISCVPNSQTLQCEANQRNKKRAKSSINLRYGGAHVSSADNTLNLQSTLSNVKKSMNQTIELAGGDFKQDKSNEMWEHGRKKTN